MEYYSAIKKWDLAIFDISEIREKQIPYDFTYMCNFKNKQTKSGNRPINTENKLMAAGGEGVGGWEKWVKGYGR